MLGSFSNKAIAAKARAMYGHRVTAADYEELMKKRTVGDACVTLAPYMALALVAMALLEKDLSI